MVLESFMVFVLLVPWPLPPMFMICIDVLGRELVKDTVSKNVWGNSYLPTFQHQEQPNSNSPNYDTLHKVRTAMDCLNKKLCQIRSVTDLPQTNRFVQHVGHHIKVYMKDKPHKFVYELLCCAVIWTLVTGLKFTVGTTMVTNCGKLRSLIWEQVAAL